MTSFLEHLPYLIYPLGASVIFSLLSGPVGSFMIWRRLSFFSDALAHGSMLGVFMALVAGWPPFWGIALVSFFLSLGLFFKSHGTLISTHTRLALLSHATLGIGLFCMSLSPYATSMIERLLGGELLTIDGTSFAIFLGLAIFVLGFLYKMWQPLLCMTLNADLAKVQGVPVGFLTLLFTLLMALTLAYATTLFGALLVTALLVMPATSARLLCHTPKTMMITGSLLSLVATLAGFLGAFSWGTPPAATLLVMHVGTFSLCAIFIPLRKVFSKAPFMVP